MDAEKKNKKIPSSAKAWCHLYDHECTIRWKRWQAPLLSLFEWRSRIGGGGAAAHSHRTRDWINPTSVLPWKTTFKGKSKEQSNANTFWPLTCSYFYLKTKANKQMKQAFSYTLKPVIAKDLYWVLGLCGQRITSLITCSSNISYYWRVTGSMQDIPLPGCPPSSEQNR